MRTVLARHDYLTRTVLREGLADWVAGPEQTGAQRRNAIARASDALEQHVNEALPAGVRWMPSIGAICGPSGDRLPSGADGTFASWFRERLDEVPLAEDDPQEQLGRHGTAFGSPGGGLGRSRRCPPTGRG